MKYPIGILDYGIGGVDLVKKIKSRHPDTPILYFSDAGEIPYGKLSNSKLRLRVKKVLDFMFCNNVEHIVVACHSASSVILDSDINVISIMESTVKAVIESGVNKLAIIGGERTIRSQKYRHPFDIMNIKVTQRVAQEFSILIEAGMISKINMKDAIQRILSPIKKHEGILLACTHYAAIASEIKTFVDQKTILIDPVEYIYDSIEEKLVRVCELNDIYYTTGDPDLMKTAAKSAFNFNIDTIIPLELS